jgi:hypothetical protein
VIDEVGKRKATFDEANSVWVTFADDQRFAVPKPWLEIRPVFRDGRAVNNFPALTYGPELEALIEAIGETDTFWAQLCFIATLGAKLLLHQYDLTDEDLDQLLAFRQDEPASMEWAERLIDIATGKSGPKVGRAGDV